MHKHVFHHFYGESLRRVRGVGGTRLAWEWLLCLIESGNQKYIQAQKPLNLFCKQVYYFSASLHENLSSTNLTYNSQDQIYSSYHPVSVVSLHLNVVSLVNSPFAHSSSFLLGLWLLRTDEMKREVKRNLPHVKRQKLALGPGKPSAWEAGGWLHWKRKQEPHKERLTV